MSYKYDPETKVLMGVGLNNIALGIQELLNINIDFEESQFNPRVSRIVTDKGLIANKTWNQTLRELVVKGDGVLKGGTAISRSGIGHACKYYIRFDSVPEQQAVEEIKEIVDESVEQVEEVVVETKEQKLPDLEYARSLYMEDKERESRTKLDKYAEEFGIKLSARKRFENMMKDFEEAIESMKSE